MSGTVMKVFNWWDTQLKVRPYRSNMAFGTVVTIIGDCIAQRFEANAKALLEKEEEHQQQLKDAASGREHQHRPVVTYRTETFNYRRTAIYGSLAFMITPLWLNVLKLTDKLVKVHVAKPTVFRAVKQGLFTWALGSSLLPINICYLTTTFSVFVHGERDPEEIKRRILERLNRNFLTHITASLCFWSLHWLPMFLWLRPEWRMVYGASMNMCWLAIASYIQHRS